ncbi:MAG TPA: hypothetical protein VKT78_02970 [Fimbriimonadaceae bacterium]|nr:hypothetical protein [Fimbriimonadaceae bacterium]
MSDAEHILNRLESGRRSYRTAFLFALAGLTTLVAASVHWGIDNVIRTKGMNVVSDGNTLAVAAIYDHKIVFGTVKGGDNLVSAGEGPTGAGTLVLSAAAGKKVVALGTVKNGGGSLGVNGPDGVEIANASPNTTNAGSLFIDNAAGTLIGEINGDKVNGGAIVVHDAKGAETARVHQ